MSLRRGLFWLAVLGGLAFAVARQRGLAASPEVAAQPETAGRRAAGPKAPTGPSVRMFFIGNSLTYMHDMPRMLTQLARSAGINLETSQYTPGGFRLVQHAAQAEVQQRLRQGGWDYVVLQEQSQWPAFGEEQVRRDVDPAAATLARNARASSPGVRILFYLTPARRNGDPQNARHIPEVATYEGMQDRISATYRRLARELTGQVVPAGEAWRRFRRERPEVVIYGDDAHPNLAGAYLIACVFYGSVFGRNPVGNPFNPGIDPALAADIQRVAWTAARAEQGS